MRRNWACVSGPRNSKHKGLVKGKVGVAGVQWTMGWELWSNVPSWQCAHGAEGAVLNSVAEAVAPRLRCGRRVFQLDKRRKGASRCRQGPVQRWDSERAWAWSEMRADDYKSLTDKAVEEGGRAWITKGVGFCAEEFSLHARKDEKQQGLWSQTSWEQIPALQLGSNSLNFSVLQFPHLYNRANNSAYLIKFIVFNQLTWAKW